MSVTSSFTVVANCWMICASMALELQSPSNCSSIINPIWEASAGPFSTITGNGENNWKHLDYFSVNFITCTIAILLHTDTIRKWKYPLSNRIIPNIFSFVAKIDISNLPIRKMISLAHHLSYIISVIHNQPIDWRFYRRTSNF